jgi:uncharacterized membrane protein YphA (DoxX/SURF4 family)
VDATIATERHVMSNVPKEPSHYREYLPKPDGPATPDLISRLRGPDGRIPTRTRWILVGAAVLVLLVAALLGLFFKLIAVVGGLMLIISGLAFYGVKVPQLPTKRSAAIACAVSIGVLLVASLGFG